MNKVIFRAHPNCCPKCIELDGKEFDSETEIYDISHPNCLCSLEDSETHKSVKVVDILPEKTNPGPVPKIGGDVVQAVFDDEDDEDDIKNCAMKDTLQEEFYTGFSYNSSSSDELPKGTSPTTYDFGSTLVQVSPIGDFVGSNSEGLPQKEHITIESLKNVVKNISGEILVDVDHQSEITNDTKAQAWATDFRVIENIGQNSGLYARLKWTKSGRELVENREYRFLSPVWSLSKDLEPVELKSIALTNRPALKGISPIINSEPQNQENQETKNLTKSNIMDKEILEIVGIEPKDTEVSPEEKDQVLSIIKTWKKISDKAEAEKKETEIRNSYDEVCKSMELEDSEDLFELYRKDPESFAKLVETVKNTIKNSDSEEKTDEESKDEPSEKEVIEIESLNSSPKIPSELTETLYDKAMKLHGEDFLKFVRQNKTNL